MTADNRYICSCGVTTDLELQTTGLCEMGIELGDGYHSASSRLIEVDKAHTENMACYLGVDIIYHIAVLHLRKKVHPRWTKRADIQLRRRCKQGTMTRSAFNGRECCRLTE